MRLTDLVLGKKLIFKSKYPPDESVRRLKENVKSNIREAWNTNCVFGKVSEKKIFLVWHKANTRNSFQPVFQGKFKTENGVTILEGRFGIFWLTKIFLAFCVMSVIFAIPDFTQGVESLLSFFLLCLFGIAVIWLGRYLSGDGLAKITEVIEKSLSENST